MTDLPADPTSPEQKPDQSVDPLSGKENVVEVLSKLGYTVVAKILTRDEEGQTIAAYLEAINPKGLKVYIQLDTDGVVSVSNNDLVLSDGTPSLGVSKSVQHGDVSCVNGVCGIAYSCRDGLCIHDKDETGSGHLQESTYIYESPITTAGRRLSKSDKATPYPVVRMSEIVESNGAVIENVDKVHRSLRDMAFRSTVDGLNQTREAAAELAANFDLLLQEQLDAAEGLRFSMTPLNAIYQEHLQNENPNEEDIHKMREIVYNLRVRHELANDLINLSGEMVKRLPKINKLNGMVVETIDEIRGKFKDIETRIWSL